MRAVLLYAERRPERFQAEFPTSYKRPYNSKSYWCDGTNGQKTHLTELHEPKFVRVEHKV